MGFLQTCYSKMLMLKLQENKATTPISDVVLCYLFHLVDVFGARAEREAHMVTFFFRRFRDLCQLFNFVRQISQNP